jgi:hypothetical protein
MLYAGSTSSMRSETADGVVKGRMLFTGNVLADAAELMSESARGTKFIIFDEVVIYCTHTSSRLSQQGTWTQFELR